jgi:hypothetical protein
MYDSQEVMGVDRVRRVLDFDGAATEASRRDVLLWGGPGHGKVVQPDEPLRPIEWYQHKAKVCTCSLCMAAATRYVYRPQVFKLSVGQLGWVATVASCETLPPAAGDFYGHEAKNFFNSRPWRVTPVRPRYRVVEGRIDMPCDFAAWWAVRCLREGRRDDLADEWLRVAAFSLTRLTYGLARLRADFGVKLTSPIVAIGSVA